MLEMLNMAPMLLAEININIDDKAFGLLGGLLGAGLIVMGSARGIGQLAGNATEAIARQPEAANRIFTTMIIGAALIEGISLFALIICLLAIMK